MAVRRRLEHQLRLADYSGASVAAGTAAARATAIVLLVAAVFVSTAVAPLRAYPLHQAWMGQTPLAVIHQACMSAIMHDAGLVQLRQSIYPP